LRALIAPSDAAVWPTSTTIRNFAGSQVGATSFAAEDFGATGFRSSGLAAWRFGRATGFALAARFGGAAGFGAVARFAGELCFDEPLKMSSKPASLAPIGNSISATIAAAMVRQLSVLMAAQESIGREYEP